MVKHANLRVEWTLMAKDDFKSILSYYKKKSLKGYSLVKTAVLQNIIHAAKAPVIFSSDEFKTPKDIHVRAFTIYHTRVSYIIEKDKIIILRLRHTSREPKEY
jgi:plasmid stabilization system protein ParE